MDLDLDLKFQMDLDMDLDFIFYGFGYGFGLTLSHGLDWILDSNYTLDLDLDLDLILHMDSNPNPRIQIHASTNIAFYCLTSLIGIYSHSVTYPLWFDTNYDIVPYTYASYKTSVSWLWELIETWGFRELHDIKCVTCYMTQNM